MAVRLNCFSITMQTIALAAVLLLASVANAWGNDAERKAMIAKVNPSIVKIRQSHSLGSGFVIAVDDDTAVAVTNYHVVEGAKKMAIFFPADDKEMKDPYEADGYIEIMPQRDLALVHFKLNGKKVAPLKLAEQRAEQGDTVYTFSSSVGQPNMVIPGMVASIASGKQVARTLDRLGKDAYEKGLGYTFDITWILHTAVMSHGNSGGPIVNEKGEVVGINTMNFSQENVSTGGMAITYAISAAHLVKMLRNVGKKVKSWSSLPPPRK